MHDISPYSVRIWENMDQKNSEYEHFSRSAVQIDFILIGTIYSQISVAN